MRIQPYSIAFVLPVAFVGSVLLCSAAEASGAVHPWEFHQQRYSGHRTLNVSDADIYDYYYNSPERSVTHGLHPLNRRRYYNPRPYTFLGNHGLFGAYAGGEVDVYEYDGTIGRWTRASNFAKPPVGSDCMNYTFSKPNYRVPPFGYRCEE